MATATDRPKKAKDLEHQVWDKLENARTAMKSALIERDREVDLVLTALVAREHPLLVGPPGTAKSLLLDSLVRLCGGAKAFKCLLSKHTTPEDLFGPVSVQGLKADQYRRITTGMLPEAELAFLDEVFKCSSATLNTLLQVLNERAFVNGDGVPRPVPLLVCVAASNEWPDGHELGALFDRFLVRAEVKPIRSPAGKKRLLFGARDHAPVFADTVTRAELDLAHEASRQLPWSDEAKNGFLKVLADLASDGVVPGDRRTFKSRDVVRAAAWLSGCSEVGVEHLDVLKHTLWNDPQEQPDRVAKVVGRVADPTGFVVAERMQAARELVGTAVSPADSVAKLKVTREELKKLPKSARADAAVAEVSQLIKEQYQKLVGGED